MNKVPSLNSLHSQKVVNRRQVVGSALSTGLSLFLGGAMKAAEKGAPRRLLLRSSWQTVNIGDIAHTPGVLALLEKNLPDVEVRLWPSKVDNGVEEMLTKRFPKVTIVKGSEQLKKAFAECDFLLHGSGPSLVAERDVVKWSSETGKPYGVYGITFSGSPSTSTQPLSDSTLAKTVQVLNGAKFVFFRDSVSLGLARSLGCTCPIMEFGPDGAFATDLRDDEKAEAFLEKHALETGAFLCCIPRLRFTPYWTIPSKKADFDAKKHARNEAMKEHDHAALRTAIVEVVRQTKMKVLICPEDQTQMAIGKELLYDPLPGEIKQRVVWRPDYWLTGEALSTYVRSAGLFGNEMHSPIMCIGNGIPAIVCRWAEQTSKGTMWKDIGLDEWLFDLDREDQIAGIVPAVLAMAQDPSAAKIRATEGLSKVRERQRATMAILELELARK